MRLALISTAERRSLRDAPNDVPAATEDSQALGQLKALPGAETAAHPPEVEGAPVAPPIMKMPQASADDCKRAGGFSSQIGSDQQAVINSVVGNRSHRLQHALWHATRSGLTNKESSEVFTAFGNSWGREHKYCPPPTADFTASDYNPVGEDFLYMHRQMIGAINAAMVAGRRQCIAGWPGIPDPAQWPLPDADTSGPKSPETLAQLKVWDSKLQDPAWLASVSLSQLGMAVEITTHNNLHMRYATTQPPAGFSAAEKIGGAPIPYDGKFPANWAYDNPAYNWLADPYGAALNPTFWKIHGYVDHLIDEWLQAHNYQTIAEDCAGAPGCYQWKGTWTGSIPSYVNAPAPSAGGSPSPTDRLGNVGPGNGNGAPPEPPIDARTRKFNRQRMLKQWVGVLGGPPPTGGPLDGTPRQAVPQPSADPFQYAVQAECGAQSAAPPPPAK